MNVMETTTAFGKPFQQYAAKGYFIGRGIIPTATVSKLTRLFYSTAKRSKTPLLRQNGKIEETRLDANGFMTQVMLDPHIHGDEMMLPFKESVLELACSQLMLDALGEITLAPKHSLQQIMIFEQSATPAHQDWFYLDTFPAGYLTAAWVALEDIDPTATRFFVVPGSQDFVQMFDNRAVNESHDYTTTMTNIVNEKYKNDIVIPEMKAGDVLFWSSRLIHGSLAGSDPKKSRLSLTAHYIPKGFGYGNRFEPIQQAYPFKLVEGRPIPHLDRSLNA